MKMKLILKDWWLPILLGVTPGILMTIVDYDLYTNIEHLWHFSIIFIIFFTLGCLIMFYYNSLNVRKTPGRGRF